MVLIGDIKKLREETGAGIMDCRRALEAAGGNHDKARQLLSAWGAQKAVKKEGRATKAGLVEAYVHGGRIGAIIQVNCETDFVAKTDDFVKLVRELAMQVASMNPKDVDTLLQQEYIRDSSKTVEQLIKEAIGKLGENITVVAFSRIELGKNS